MTEVDDRYTGWSEETWTYEGIRSSGAGKRYHKWRDEKGEDHGYTDKGHFVIGGLYVVKVSRNSATLTRSQPEYTGHRNPDADYAALQAAEVVAERRIAAKRYERKDAHHSALTEALEPLVDIASKLPTSADRDHFAAYIVNQIQRSVWCREGRMRT